MTVAPFPFSSLPAYSRQEIVLTTQTRLAMAIAASLEAALADLCGGQRVSIGLRRSRPFDVATIRGDSIGVTMSTPELGLAHILVDVETPLASVIVAHALRQRAPRVVDGSKTASPEIAGAFAAVLHAALRRTEGMPPLRIVAAGPAPALARDLSGADGRLLTAWLAVTVGDEVYAARATLGIGVLRAFALGRSSWRGRLEDGLPLALPLVAATCLATRTDLLSLCVGDAFVVPSFPLRAAASGLVGPVALVPGSGERGLSGVLEETGVLRTGAVETHSWDRPTNEPTPMSAEQRNATLEVLEDAPVVVRVELGTVEMKAKDWTALHPGDVITLGRKLGDPAILRIGGVEVARGELVQVEGEMGVRISTMSRSSAGGTET